MEHKRNRHRWIATALTLILITAGVSASGNDEVILRRVPGLKAIPSNYTMQILRAALDATHLEYGPYALRYADRDMTRSRAFNEMQIGTRVNVADTPITENWTEKLIRVPIPVQRGILSYRLFLVTKENRDLLKNVKTLEDLKKNSTRKWESMGLYKNAHRA